MTVPSLQVNQLFRSYQVSFLDCCECCQKAHQNDVRDSDDVPKDCTKGRAMVIGILARVIKSGINRFILLIDDYSRSGCGNHQHSVVCAKHLVVDIDAHYGVCTQTAGTLSHFVHSLLTCLDQLALI